MLQAARKSEEIALNNQVGCRKQNKKLLGEHLIEAGLITPAQLDIALNKQKMDGRCLGKILASMGWVQQQTIEYLIKKVVLPEQQPVETEFYRPKKHQHLFSQAPQVKQKDYNLSILSFYPPRQLKFEISAKKAIWFLLFVVISLTLASLVGQFSIYFLPDYPLNQTLADLFYVDREQNIPSLYSASVLLLCCIVLAAIAYSKKIAGDSYRRYWQVLSIIFLYLSLDEIMSLHEKAIEPVRSALNTSGIFYYAWVIPGAILTFICLLGFSRFLVHLPAKIGRLFLIAGSIFVGGALGVELIGGYYADFYNEQSMVYAIIVTIEESLEMLGIVVFVYALLSYINTYMEGLSLQLTVVSDRQQRRST